ncbi:MAG: hypothetical protein Q8M31_21665 [Beijerinckiaceae bacterium]|nr:hypothetical protein [Beijerinckiaceae bacterium]
MAFAHRHGDARVCGASTIVTGQNFVTVEGQLWAVHGDPNSHGAGDLISSRSWITIDGKPIIVQGDAAAADNLCPIVGGPHCAPSAVGHSTLTDVQ